MNIKSIIRARASYIRYERYLVYCIERCISKLVNEGSKKETQELTVLADMSGCGYNNFDVEIFRKILGKSEKIFDGEIMDLRRRLERIIRLVSEFNHIGLPILLQIPSTKSVVKLLAGRYPGRIGCVWVTNLNWAGKQFWSIVGKSIA